MLATQTIMVVLITCYLMVKNYKISNNLLFVTNFFSNICARTLQQNGNDIIKCFVMKTVLYISKVHHKQCLCDKSLQYSLHAVLRSTISILLLL